MNDERKDRKGRISVAVIWFALLGALVYVTYGRMHERSQNSILGMFALGTCILALILYLWDTKRPKHK